MSEKMKCVAVTGKRKIDLIEVNKPIPKENEIQIKIRACALCTWEQRTYTGEKKIPFPMVAGHEISGEISALGSNVDSDQYKIGTRVSARVINACQRCYYCRKGLHTQCIEQNTFPLDGPEIFGMGGLAEYICLDRSIVWCFPDDLSFEEIAFTEPVACVLHSIHQASPMFGDDALVIGGGTMGQLHLLCLKRMGIRTILSEPDLSRRNFAREHGCDDVIDPLSENLMETIQALTNGRGVETVFNTTAVPGVMDEAVKTLTNAGTYIAFSSQHPDEPVPISPGWLHSTEIKLTGAVNPSILSFNQSATILAKNIIDIRDLISGVYPMEQATQAYEAAIRPDTYRIIITF